MRLTAGDLKKAGIVERVLPEPAHLTKENLVEVTGPMDSCICEFLKKHGALTPEELTEKRYERFRQM